MANLITAGNSGTFESNITGWTQYQATLSRDTTDFHSGVASMKAVATTTSFPGGYSNAMTLVVGTSYRWGVWLKGTGTVRVGFFASAYIAGAYTDCVMSPSGWTYFQQDWVADRTAAYLFIGGTTVAAAASYWIDDASVDLTPVVVSGGGGGSAVRNGAKKALTDSLIRAGAKKSLSIALVRAGAKKSLT